MILIFSYMGDFSTDLVVDWLNYYRHPLYRINSSDIYNYSLKIDLSNKQIYLDNVRLPLEIINAVWFRKFGLKKDFDLFKKENVNHTIAMSLRISDYRRPLSPKKTSEKTVTLWQTIA